LPHHFTVRFRRPNACRPRTRQVGDEAKPSSVGGRRRLNFFWHYQMYFAASAIMTATTMTNAANCTQRLLAKLTKPGPLELPPWLLCRFITGSPPLDHRSGYDPVFNELVSESSGFRRQAWLWGARGRRDDEPSLELKFSAAQGQDQTNTWLKHALPSSLPATLVFRRPGSPLYDRNLESHL
jgi:hypothetical protein